MLPGIILISGSLGHENSKTRKSCPYCIDLAASSGKIAASSDRS
jgi:hypothetical protein